MEGESLEGVQTTDAGKELLIREKILQPRATTIGKELRGAKIEESFLHFCTKYLEAPERQGRLPGFYTSLSNDEFSELVRLPKMLARVEQKSSPPQAFSEDEKKALALSEELDRLRKKEEVGEELSSKEIETLRLSEAVDSVVNHTLKTVEVHDVEHLHNPLGELGDVTLLIFADLHYVPSIPETQIRELAFRRYAPIRFASRIVDKLVAEGKVFSGVERELLEKTGSKKVAENVYKRYILRQSALSEYRQWMVRVIKSGFYGETTRVETRPVLISLGDVVHDGASLDAQISERSSFREILDETQEKDTKLIEINGNHDNDSRVPESVTLLSELYGQGIFTQEVSGGVLIAGIDTNIENPKWVEQFIARQGESGEKVLGIRKKLQEEVKKRIRGHSGPVIVLGHNPSRMVEALAVKDDILQNSNVQRLIAGHTHKENHVVLPIKNASGGPIVMDVIESFVKVENGKPKPPKLYALDIKGGKVSQVRTLSEPGDAFSKGVEARL
jgi:hypothetical protein